VYAVADGNYPTGQNTHVSRGTTGTPTVVRAGDKLDAQIVFGHDGTSYRPSSLFVSIVDPFQTVSTGVIPGAIGLSVLTDGNPANINSTIFMDSRGYVGIANGYNQPKAHLDINGFAKLKVLTAAPSGTLEEGMIAIADGSNWNPMGTGKKVVVAYLGGGWRQMATAP
jgi:hypothetical protein